MISCVSIFIISGINDDLIAGCALLIILVIVDLLACIIVPNIFLRLKEVLHAMPHGLV